MNHSAPVQVLSPSELRKAHRVGLCKTSSSEEEQTAEAFPSPSVESTIILESMNAHLQ